MTQNNNSWKRNYFTLLIGQGVSFISSGILQMAIIFLFGCENEFRNYIDDCNFNRLFTTGLFRAVCGGFR